MRRRRLAGPEMLEVIDLGMQAREQRLGFLQALFHTRRQHLGPRLGARSREWWFSYTVIAWHGDLPDWLDSDVQHFAQIESGMKPTIPIITSPPASPRRPRTLMEFQQEAESLGVLELFEAMRHHAEALDGLEADRFGPGKIV